MCNLHNILRATGFGLVAALSAAALAAPGLSLSQTSYLYKCAGNKELVVSYLNTAAEKVASPHFVVLRYQGKRYGLAEAVSGSGSRYVGLAGLTTAEGLEWWEHQGEATLSTFPSDAPNSSTPVLERCRLSK